MNAPQLSRMGTAVTKGASCAVFAVFALAAIMVGSLAGLIATANAVEDSCADVEVVFAREATDAPVAGASSAAFVDPHLPDPPGVTTDYRVLFGVEQSLTDIAKVGKRSQVVAATCPATKIVGGSYVQGDRRGRVRHVQRRTFWIRPARRTRSGRRGLRPNAAVRWRHGYCQPDVPYQNPRVGPSMSS
jgi:hypothetical protein